MSTKISALPAAAAVNLSDTTVLPLVDTTTTTVKVSIAQLRTQIHSTLITSTVDGLQFLRLGVSTSAQYFDVRNTSGVLTFGVEGAAASLIAGATPYDAAFRGNSGVSFSGDGGVTLHVRIASTGIASFAKQVIITTGGLLVNAGLLTLAAANTSAPGTGTDIVFGATTQTTVGSTGSASLLPANPFGYLVFYKGVTKFAIPYYLG